MCKKVVKNNFTRAHFYLQSTLAVSVEHQHVTDGQTDTQ